MFFMCSQVLSPVKGGPAGVHNLNRLLKEQLNPRGGDGVSEGDKVIQPSLMSALIDTSIRCDMRVAWAFVDTLSARGCCLRRLQVRIRRAPKRR